MGRLMAESGVSEDGVTGVIQLPNTGEERKEPLRRPMNNRMGQGTHPCPVPCLSVRRPY